MIVHLNVKVDSYMVLIYFVEKEMDACATSNTNVKLSCVCRAHPGLSCPVF